MINREIFKAYDVRGVYPADLDARAAYAVGRAFAKKTGVKHAVVGYDARLSSAELLRGLAAGLLSAGCQTHCIGQTPTEGLYFAVANYDFPAGIMITASHNPKEYNGFKMMTREGNDIAWVRGKDLLDFVEDDVPELLPEADIRNKDIWQDYMRHVFSLVDLAGVVPMKIAVDASNGVMGELFEPAKDRLPAEVIPLNFTPDGNFPNHSPNPLEPGSADGIRQIIKSQALDFGIMFDGDADRIFLLDEAGQMVKGDITLLLLAKHFLQKNPGMAIAYNAICSKAVPEFVVEWGGVPIRTQVGFVNVREGLINNNGIMGGETSCHYCFKDYWYMDSGMVAFLTLLTVISQDGRKVSEMVRELQKYAKSDELNFTVADKEAVLRKVTEKYADGSPDFLDGVTVSYPDWWFNVRPSNTEPLLRLTIEASTPELLAKKQKELTEFIGQS